MLIFIEFLLFWNLVWRVQAILWSSWWGSIQDEYSLRKACGNWRFPFFNFSYSSSSLCFVLFHPSFHLLDVPFIDYPIFVKILWKRDRTLRIDYKEKKLTIYEQTTPRLVISGRQLKKVCWSAVVIISISIFFLRLKMEADKSDATAIILTYETGVPKKPIATETIYAESKEVLSFLGFFVFFTPRFFFFVFVFFFFGLLTLATACSSTRSWRLHSRDLNAFESWSFSEQDVFLRLKSMSPSHLFCHKSNLFSSVI